LSLARVFVVSTLVLTLVPCALSQQANVSPPSLNFAAQVAAAPSAGSQSQTVTVTNGGNADLIVSSVLASGGYKQTNNCSTVSPHVSCTVEVTFEPGTTGLLNGAITISDNAPSSPQIVSLFGTGIAPIQLSPSAVSFGAVAVGTTSQPRSITVTAAPSTSFSINQISTSGDFAQDNNCPTSLQGGQSCTIKVAFHPTVNTVVNGALAVSTAFGNLPLAFSAALTGTGSGNIVSHVSVQPAVVNFGNKGPDFVDSVQPLTVTNTSGNTSLTIHDITLSGSPNAVGGFPMYKINSSTCPRMLAPGAQCTIEVAFSTMFSRLFPESYPGALTISDSDPTSPHVVGIAGNQVEELTFRPTSVVSPLQPVGTTTSKTITVTGNDLQAGLVLDMTASGDFSATGDLGPCFLQPGATCRMTISFTPTQKGVINGSVTLETYPECIRSRCTSARTQSCSTSVEPDSSNPRPCGVVYSTGEADAECAGRELSRTATRRVFERELVSESVRCQAQDRSVEDGIQR
jgi:hypothetical protein